jgi:RHS repeat-associated protein
VVTTIHSVSVFQGFGWSTTPLATQVYSYDSASRLTSETDKEGTASFTYDNANELTGVTCSRSESYSYDLNGNRTGTGYHTTVMNEMTTAPGHTYTYDNTGNLISDNNGSSITTYTYDYRNRLVSVTTGGTVVATYTYNALNQRIGVNDGGTQTWTVYDGPSPDAHPYADFNGSGSLTMHYLFGPGEVNGAVMSVILARTSSGGTTAWYLTDKLGSVRDVVDSSGNVLDHTVYDGFGNIVTETNATNGDRFKFAGMQYDAITGQYFDDARWYGCGSGRYSSLDPMGFAAGDANFYRYVFNYTTGAVDPSGKAAVDWTQVDPFRSLGPEQWKYLRDLIKVLEKMKNQSGLSNEDMRVLQGIINSLKKASFLIMIDPGMIQKMDGNHYPGTDLIYLNPMFFNTTLPEQVKVLLHEGYHMAYEYDKNDKALLLKNRPLPYPNRTPTSPEHYAEFYAERVRGWLKLTPEWDSFTRLTWLPWFSGHP